MYEEYRNPLLLLHKECSPPWDWHAIHALPRPVQPIPSDVYTREATADLAHYVPRWIDRLTGRHRKQRALLITNIQEAEKQDRQAYATAMHHYERDLTLWEKFQPLAQGILAHDIKSYIEVIREISTFSHIPGLKSHIDFRTAHSWYLEALFDVHGEDVLLTEYDAKKLSKSRIREMHKYYITSCVLRIARECSALLPLSMIFLHVFGEIVNQHTGQIESQPILSVALPRTTLVRLNFDALDCTYALNNFQHNIAFHRLRGFSRVEMLTPAQWSQDRHDVPISHEDASPYETLGVHPGASMDEMTRAYHRLAKMYHPDKVAHLAPEFRAMAEQRMKDINKAYDIAKKAAMEGKRTTGTYDAAQSGHDAVYSCSISTDGIFPSSQAYVNVEEDEYDEKYDDAVALVMRTRQASITLLQRCLRVGYNRAARMLEMMEKEGIVGPADGIKPRAVLVGTPEESAPAMSTCYQCGRAIHGQGYRREVYTGHSTGMYFGRRASASIRSHHGMRTLCAQCAEAQDSRAYIGMAAVGIVIVLGLIGLWSRSPQSTHSISNPGQSDTSQKQGQLPQGAQLPAGMGAESPDGVVRQYYAALTRHDVEAARGTWKTPPPRLQDMVQQVDWYRIEHIRLAQGDTSAAQVEVTVTGKRLNQQPERWSGTVELAQIAGAWKIVTMHLTKH